MITFSSWVLWATEYWQLHGLNILSNQSEQFPPPPPVSLGKSSRTLPRPNRCVSKWAGRFFSGPTPHGCGSSTCSWSKASYNSTSPRHAWAEVCKPAEFPNLPCFLQCIYGRVLLWCVSPELGTPKSESCLNRSASWASPFPVFSQREMRSCFLQRSEVTSRALPLLCLCSGERKCG